MDIREAGIRCRGKEEKGNAPAEVARTGQRGAKKEKKG